MKITFQEWIVDYLENNIEAQYKIKNMAKQNKKKYIPLVYYNKNDGFFSNIIIYDYASSNDIIIIRPNKIKKGKLKGWTVNSYNININDIDTKVIAISKQSILEKIKCRIKKKKLII